MLPERMEPALNDITGRLSAAMLRLDPGPLARLRRMEVDGPGESAFWGLAQACGFLDSAGGGDGWLRLVKIMAILIPRGEPSQRGILHDARCPLGAVLCDGGDRSWTSGTQDNRSDPLLSETRLARFLALPAERRGAALESIARMLARRRDPQGGIDCTDIACLLLSDDVRFLRRLAETYYRRLDAAGAVREKEPAA